MSNIRRLVAVVDDDKSFRTALRRLITSSGLNCATFESGEMFLDSFAARRPDCTLLDFHMPGLSGLDVLRLLKTKGWEVPVIIITGRDQPTTRAQCLAAGAQAYLVKPVKPGELLQLVSEAVGTEEAEP